MRTCRFARVLADRVALALDSAGLFSDLQSIERRMDTVMGVLEEAVVIHDSGGNVVFANAAAARMFGFDDPDEMVDLPKGGGATLRRLRREGRSALPNQVAPIGPSRRGARHADVPDDLARDRRGALAAAKSQTVEGLEGRPLYAVTASRTSPS